MTKKRFLGILAILAVVLMAAELAARRLLPDVTSCLEVSRNPYRFRAWPEFMSGIQNPPRDTGLLVLLSNSQGYAGEYDYRKIYPARLQTLLTDRKLEGFPQWRVLNWSTDGMTSIELVLMAAFLRDHPPDIVLAVTGYADYAAEHENSGFMYSRNDIPRLAARPAIYRLLPRSYTRRHVHAEDTLTNFLHDRLALLRYREFVWSWLETRFPGIHRMFYAPSINYLPWTMKMRPIVTPLKKNPHAPGDPVMTYQNGSRQMLEENLSMLQKIDARIIVVAQPLVTWSGDPRQKWHTDFMKDLADLTRRHKLPLWDLAEELPTDGFLTSSHFRMENHKRFADILDRKLATTQATPDNRDQETP